MGEEVYKLWEIPLKQPSIVANAVKFVDQAPLLTLLDRHEKLPRSKLMPMAELAIKSGAIKTAKACLVTGEVLTFVDLATFPQEFDQFISSVMQHKLEVTEADIHHLLTYNNVKLPKFKRSVMHWATSHDWSLRILEKLCFTPSDFIRLAGNSVFPPFQIREEIGGLLDLLVKAHPKQILEIGTDKGGTLYLFTKVADDAATLVSADLQIANVNLFSSFARMRQHVNMIQGNSQEVATVEETKKQFPTGVDFLFLDGDHLYEGVKRNFLNYSPLVRDGGLIAFHDIVEDNETRYGVVTGGWSGGVPRFWKEIKSEYRHVEFIQSPDQDGLGIGVLFFESGQK